ncbi:MAG: glycosyltransferase family 4 protein [Alphaproteobacteria bacterium]
MTRKPRLLFLVTEDWYFLSHRLPIARAARDAGAEVLIATRFSHHHAAIAAEGFKILPLKWERGGQNPFQELRTVFQLAVLYYRWRPDLVHHVAIKPILLGSLSAWVVGFWGVRPQVINAVTGLGYFFISPKSRLSWLIYRLLSFALNRPRTTLILQNKDDHATLLQNGLLHHDRIRLIRGSGVDLDEFPFMPLPEGPPIAALVARMLSDKGIYETVEAARMLRDQGVNLKIYLVGPTDPANPAAISSRMLEAWTKEGIISWLGPRQDVSAIWKEAAIAVLPSYREGLPKALLEAASCGRPIVATDAPGCREICHSDETGLLVPVGDAEALAAALARLAKDPSLRHRLGISARRLVEQEFSTTRVIEQTLDLYHHLIPGQLTKSPMTNPHRS